MKPKFVVGLRIADNKKHVINQQVREREKYQHAV